MAFDLKTAKPAGPTLPARKGFDMNTARPATSLPLAVGAYGPLGRGAVAAERGASLQDLPYMAAKTVSGSLAGIPEMVANDPRAAFLEKGSRFSTGEPKRSVFPKAATIEGGRLGNELELAGGAVDVNLVGQKAAGKYIPMAKDAINRAVDVARNEIPTRLPLAKRQVLRTLADKEGVLSGLENVARRTAQKEKLGVSEALRGEIEGLSARANPETIRKEVEALTQQLNTEVREGALTAQKALPKYFAKRSREYGNALDGILQKAESESRFIPAAELAESLSKTAQDLGIDYAGVQSPIEKEIQALAMKYTEEAAQGRPVRFDELIGVKRRIESMVSAAKQAGTQPYGAGEHSLSSFRENVGGLLERYLPELKELNRGYAPFIKLKRQAVRVFKPFAGEYETKAGEGFIKRAVLPRLKGTSEDALLTKLEADTGVPFSARARQTTGKIQTAKQAQREAERAIGDEILQARSAAKQKIRTISEAAQQRIIELEAKKKKVSRNVVGRGLGMARQFAKYGSGRIL